MTPPSEHTLQLQRIFPGDSEMAQRMRALDWSQTELGPPERWPENLRTAVSICLTSRFPIFLWWGRDFTLLYNDAYVPVLGPGKHPQWLGRSGRECWSEIWDTIGPLVDSVRREGRATWSEELLLVMDRHLPREETYFTFSYSPILSGDATGVDGIFCACTETTDYVLGRRRLGTLRELGRRTAKVHTAEEACQRAAEVIAENEFDVPFAALYLLDRPGGAARLAASVRAGDAFEARIDRVATQSARWPVLRVWDTRREEDVPLADDEELGGGAWPEHPCRAVALPVTAPGLENVGAVLIAGVNPRRPLDPEYRDFFRSIAMQVGAAVAEACAYESERRRAESLAEVDRAKTAFFSNVSHEFRTPLTLMLGPMEEALESGALAPAQRASIETAHRNSLRLLRLVNTLLDFSRIEAGRAEAIYEPVDIATLTADLASAFRSAVEKAGLQYEVRCTPATQPAYVDRDMWEKVVLNLLSNAFKFTLDGRIEVTQEQADGHHVLRIADTGIGIPPEELPNLFKRFHRVRSAAGRTHEGTGIGLALVHELVKLHGGSVDVESGPGAGTTFTVRIPMGNAHLPPERVGVERRLASTAVGAAPFVQEAMRWLTPAEVEREPADAVLEHVRTGGLRVLVADDNADMRAYVARILRKYWEIETVADGEEALASMKQRRPDLVLTDIMMPRLDGVGLLQAIRADAELRAVPVILLSARAGEESRVEGLSFGADDYLTKPFSARELLARVNAHLEMALVRREAQREREELLQRETAARREAQLQHEHLHMLFMQAPAPICMLRGPEYRIELANGSMCEAWGRAREDIIDRPLFEALPELTNQAVRALLDEVYASGIAYVGREALVRMQDGDGTTRDAVYDFVYAPWRDLDGSIEGIMAIAFDVTETARARQQMDQLRTEAEQANRAKDEFLAVLSHELRSPMNAMLGWLRILKTAGTHDEDLVRRATDTIERNIWVQAQVVNDLLDVSRIISGKLQLDRQRVDVASVLMECVESLRPTAEGKQITLRVEIERDDADVIGDGARLQQVIANLLGNAIKFTETGGSISIGVGGGPEQVRLVVEDTGHGIDPEFLPHLFERFRQADSTTARKFGGLGLGLAIVKNVVELHGGSVVAESDGIGSGARFIVILPAAEPRSAAVMPRREVQRAQSLDGARVIDVLLVEDDNDSRDALQLALAENGAQVRAVASIRHALEAYESRRPDVLISDIGMPDGDGYVLIKTIREREEGYTHRTLAVAITGFAARQDREMALRAGFDEHVGKPVEPEALLERLRVLDAARAASQR